MNIETRFKVARDFERPKDGWRYTVPETGVTLEGDYFKTLYEKVRKHCVVNGLPAPPIEDIEDAACRETNPGGKHCIPRPSKPVAGMLPHLTLSMAERFVRSVWAALKNKEMVPREEAERRYRICTEECSLATDIGGCVGCHGVLKMVEKAMTNNPLPDIPKKRWCGACGCSTRLKAFLTNEALDRAESVRPQYWEKCWRYQPDPAPVKTE